MLRNPWRDSKQALLYVDTCASECSNLTAGTKLKSAYTLILLLLHPATIIRQRHGDRSNNAGYLSKRTEWTTDDLRAHGADHPGRERLRGQGGMPIASVARAALGADARRASISGRSWHAYHAWTDPAAKRRLPSARCSRRCWRCATN